MIDLARWVRPGDTVLWGQANAEPRTLTQALVAQRHALARLRLVLGIDLSRTLQPEHADAFDFVSYCGAGGNRALARAGVLNILPCPYSQLPRQLRAGDLQVDVVLLQVSPPDAHGRHSLGIANDLLIAALETARVVIAECHADVPWTHGARTLQAHEIDLLVEATLPPLENPPAPPSETSLAIARNVARWIEDGATLQLGLGGIPDAVLPLLADRRDLGLHSGVIGDGVAELMECGALTSARKSIDAGVGIAGMLMGSQRLYRFANRNPALQLRGSDYTHGGEVLRRVERFVAINSAIEVDLTGQVNAEVAMGDYVGAVGGAPDFIRAAQCSRGGLSIIALPATAMSRSRIVSTLSGPVTTPRCDAGIFVTEYGVADLRGLGLAARRRRMLEIAAPEHRDALDTCAPSAP
ncbi:MULTISPECIES: acetyl-CoA hydrolase/transferase family protein [unclassified Variovorax]|uniref:acetyl-CoA hydrolase/transferase family protein n=1 Tax=unclassified Variovorax TaxID=663243 RepID=UPI001BD6D8BC|nr:MULTISPECIES: acetyl-CoA hydrolase/transferase C-terminal domain-containing protein [unclassified Variovorax]